MIYKPRCLKTHQFFHIFVNRLIPLPCKMHTFLTFSCFRKQAFIKNGDFAAEVLTFVVCFAHAMLVLCSWCDYATSMLLSCFAHVMFMIWSCYVAAVLMLCVAMLIRSSRADPTPISTICPRRFSFRRSRERGCVAPARTPPTDSNQG